VPKANGQMQQQQQPTPVCCQMNTMKSIFDAQSNKLIWVRRDSAERARHRTEFEILSRLGAGAFGTVYKVQNRVDSHMYALKSVKIRGIDSEKVLIEVQVLSSLNSENVVRYYAAWVEKHDSSVMGARFEGEVEVEDSLLSASTSSDLIDESEQPICNLCNTPYVEWEVSFEHWGLIDAVLQPLDLCRACYLNSIPSHADRSRISIREKKVLPDYLFILMEYCECSLYQAVEECGADQAKIWSYFAQCCQGLAQLHSKGVIHRDVKPDNIFVRENVVKIGDLGLAKTVLAQDMAESGSVDEVGTFLYTAPEMKTGKCSPACDVYSLGIVLVEIFSSFSTGMERAKVLSTLDLPGEWVTAHPLQTQLARRMVAPDPVDRPSCSQILGELVHDGLWEQPRSFIRLQEQIDKLQAQLESKQVEATQLRQLLDEHHIPHGHIS
jgi:serine/threonine protein kinase